MYNSKVTEEIIKNLQKYFIYNIKYFIYCIYFISLDINQQSWLDQI